MSDEKKSDPLATHIAQDVINEALASVARHTKSEPDGVAVEIQPQPVPAAPTAPAAPPEDAARLKADLLQARQTLRQREAELEMSQAMARETLDKLKDQHERTLRAVADLDNFKKRVQREREEQAKFGQEKLLRDVLPVLDNLERALEHARSAAELDALKSGVEMTRKLFESTLARYGVKGFSSAGQVFDPQLHEAMQTVESELPAGTVVQELVRGYLHHERLMRPAMVAVARARAEPPAPQEGAAAGAATPAEADPKVGGPADPKVGGPADPNVGGPADPNVGGPADPNVGGPAAADAKLDSKG